MYRFEPTHRRSPLVCCLFVLGVLAIMPLYGQVNWVQLSSVPEDYVVDKDASIVYGAGRIWGIFVLPEEGEGEDDLTCLLSYDCETDQWSYIEELDWLEYTAVAYQPGVMPGNSGAVYIVGNEDQDAEMYWYNIDDDDLEPGIVEFEWFGPGAALAHGRAGYPPTQPTYPNPGWLYCLRGGTTNREFWRYVPEYDIAALDSICPKDSAVFGDRTPPFAWIPVSGAGSYRLVVASDSAFQDTVLDQQTQSASYQSTCDLDSGVYFWKTGSSDGLGSWSWGTARSFRVDFSWAQLADLPDFVTAGAALAHDYKYWYTESGDGLVAFPGGGCQRMWLYDIPSDDWVTGWSNVPYPEVAGTDLVTPPSGADSLKPFAVFGQQGNSYAYRHMLDGSWESYGTALPVTLYEGAALAYAHHEDSEGVLQDWLYLIVGDDRRNFYRLQLTENTPGGGEQTQDSRSMSATARIVGRAEELVLQYRLDVAGPVRFTVCDVVGRVRMTLHTGLQVAGAHEMHLNPQDWGAGAYIVVLDAGLQQARLKVLVR